MRHDTNKAARALIAHHLTDAAQVEIFLDGMRLALKRALHPSRGGKQVNLVVSVVTGEEKFGPMVDMLWAASAMPCSKEMLSHYIKRAKPKMDPPVFRRVVRIDGRNQRIRLLSLHDLKCIRGVMLSRTPGKQVLADRGDIIV